MQKTMKALVKKYAKEGLWLEEVPVPKIGVHDVLIKVLNPKKAKTIDIVINENPQSAYKDKAFWIFLASARASSRPALPPPMGATR